MAAAHTAAAGLQRLAAAATEQLRLVSTPAHASAASHDACTRALQALTDAWRAAAHRDRTAAAQRVAASGLFSAIAAACSFWEATLEHQAQAQQQQQQQQQQRTGQPRQRRQQQQRAAASGEAHTRCQVAAATVWAALLEEWPKALLKPAADGIGPRAGSSSSVSHPSVAASVLPIAAWALAALRCEQPALLPLQRAVLQLVDELAPLLTEELASAAPAYAAPGSTAASWVADDLLLRLLLARLAIDAAQLHHQLRGLPPGTAAAAAAGADSAVPARHELFFKVDLTGAALQHWQHEAPVSSTSAAAAAAAQAAADDGGGGGADIGDCSTSSVLYAIEALASRRGELGESLMPFVPDGPLVSLVASMLLFIQLEVAALAPDAGLATAAVHCATKTLRIVYKAVQQHAARAAVQGAREWNAAENAMRAGMAAVFGLSLRQLDAEDEAAALRSMRRNWRAEAVQYAADDVMGPDGAPALSLLLPAVARLAPAPAPVAAPAAGGSSSTAAATDDEDGLALCQDAGLLLAMLLGPASAEAATAALKAVPGGPAVWLPALEAAVRSLGVPDDCGPELLAPEGMPSPLRAFRLLELPQRIVALMPQALPPREVAAEWQRPVCTLLASCLKLAHLVVLTHPPFDVAMRSDANRARWQLLLLAIGAAQAATALGWAAVAAAGGPAGGGDVLTAAAPWTQLLAHALVLAADALEPRVEEDERGAGCGFGGDGYGSGSDSDDDSCGSDASASVDEFEDDSDDPSEQLQQLQQVVRALSDGLHSLASVQPALQSLQQQAAALAAGLGGAAAACEDDEESGTYLFSSDLLQAARKAMQQHLGPLRRLAKALAGELPSPWLCNSPSCLTVAGTAEGACLTRCGRCRCAALCGGTHQRAMWPHHKAACARLAKAASGSAGGS